MTDIVPNGADVAAFWQKVPPAVGTEAVCGLSGRLSGVLRVIKAHSGIKETVC